MEDRECLKGMSSFVLTASTCEIAQFWNVSDNFEVVREGILTRKRPVPAARTYLQLSWGLVVVYEEKRESHLLDNALVALAAGIRDGLDQVTPKEIDDALTTAFAPPLASENSRLLFEQLWQSRLGASGQSDPDPNDS